jgi:hypothetical protein
MWTKKKAMSNAGVAPAVKRGRGRPRKVDKAKEEEEEEEALATEEVPAVVVAAPPTIDLSVCQSCTECPEPWCKSPCIIVTDPCLV